MTVLGILFVGALVPAFLPVLWVLGGL